MNEALLLLLAPLATAAGLLWSLLATVLWSGRWRALAAVPIAAVALYGLLVLVPDWIEDPSSHNLLPFEIGLFFCPSLPYMAVVTAIRRHTAGRAVT